MGLINLFKKNFFSIKRFNYNKEFDLLYPPHIQKLSKRHWTPVAVSDVAARFLSVKPNSKILDIGSGVGKFCLCAARLNPDCKYYGIEQRQTLVEYAEKAKQFLNLQNVIFIQGDISAVNFSDYDHFYFFNSFYEQLEEADKIDPFIEYSKANYEQYRQYLFEQLERLPVDTRLVTYHGREEQVPSCYALIETSFEGLLKCWIKK